MQLTDVKGTGNLVAFEECYLVKDPSVNTLVLVGDHKDKNDKAQLYKKTGRIVISDKDSFANAIKTGDTTAILAWIAIFAAAVLALVFMLMGVKRRSRGHDDPLI